MTECAGTGEPKRKTGGGVAVSISRKSTKSDDPRNNDSNERIFNRLPDDRGNFSISTSFCKIRDVCCPGMHSTALITPLIRAFMAASWVSDGALTSFAACKTRVRISVLVAANDGYNAKYTSLNTIH